MADSYSVKAILSASDKGFTSTINKALSSVKSAMSSITFGALTSMGSAAFGALSNGVSGLVSEINNSNAAWKTFEGNMSILGKGSGEISAAKKELQEYAQQTVYSSSDMANTYAQLAAVGVKDTAKLVKGFGGLAAAAEDPQQAMKTLSTQATQMAAKPTVAWADFKLMLEQSPAGMAAVAKQMGMTTSELVTNIQAGTVKTDEFFAAINEVGNSKGFADLATEAKTMGQAMDGLKETLGNKLTPAFDVLSKIGIKAIDKISGALSKIDAQGLANKVSGWVKKAQPLWNSFRKAVSKVWGVVSGVGKKLAPIFKSMSSTARSSFKSMLDAIGKIDVNSIVNKVGGALEKAKPYWVSFKNTVVAIKDAVAAVLPYILGALKKIGAFFLDNSETISKAIPWIIGLVGAYKGMKIVNTIAHGVASFAKSLASMASKSIAGLASKLFGIATAQKATGTASATAAPSMMKSALAILAIGGAVFLAAAGLALLVYSAIQLAAAGWPAVAALVGLVAVIALFAVGAAALGASLTAGAIGFIAFGAAIALIGVGAFLAGAGLALVASVLPLIVTYGLQGAVAIAALGLGMIVFAAGAAVAGVACVVLGAGLLVIAAALLVAGAAMLLFGAGALLAAASLSIISLVLPTIAAYGLQGAVAFLALSAAFLVFGAGAAVAGAAALILGAGLLVTAAAVLLLAAGVAVLSAAVLVLAAGFAIIAASITMTAAAFPLMAASAMLAAGAFMALLGAAAILAPMMLVLSVALIALTAGAAVGAIGIAAFGLAMTAASVGTIVMAGALLLVTAEMKSIAKSAKSAKKSLTSMRKSVDFVETGLKSIKNIAKSAMSRLLEAFDNTAGKVKSAGQKVGKGFGAGMKTGLLTAPILATAAIMQIMAALNAGVAAAQSAGINIGVGFANGMRSQLANIKSVAAQMAAAADAAVRAKAKIHSPSKVSGKLGTYWGEGFVNSIVGMAKEAWKAASMLVSVPNLATPDFAMAYAGELSADYNYTRSAEYTIEVPVVLDGKEVAKVTAPYTEAELNKRQTRNSRKRGKL